MRSGINQGSRALDFNQVANREYLRHELWLTDALEKLDEISGESDACVRSTRKQAVNIVQAELSRLEEMKASEWRRQEKLQSRV